MVDLSPFAGSISNIESGGNYSLLGPSTRNGDRAYGRYQVMGNNIPSWTQEVLGRQMTPQQFLADPQAQDAVFNAKFGGYVQKYGPEGAARAWFAGPGGMNDPGRRDVLGTSVADYGRRFMAGLNGNQPPPVPPASIPNPPGSPVDMAYYLKAIGADPNLNMPLFSPQQQPQAQQQQPQQAPQSLLSLLAPPTSQPDVAAWFARQNPQG